MKNNKFYITTPLYYPNDNLHIGHAYSTVIADVLARYKRNAGFEVMFLTGSDEHGEKIEKKSKSENIEPKKYVDKIVDNFKNLWSELDISYDAFIRTTDPKHEEHVRNIFNKLLKDGKIYKGNYEGNYCSSCETFFTKTQLEEDELCPECKAKTYPLKEESYFLKIKEEQKFIKDLITKKGFLVPNSRVNELVNSFVDNNLQDLSLTRKNFSWGVPIKEDEETIIYVWFDALIGYLSGVGTYDNNEFWNDDVEIVQILGKEITRFHCIYWPVILKSLGVRMPNTFLSHGWIIDESGKMSKTKGNVVDPVPLIKEYGSDALRFFLMSQISIKSDGVYSEQKLKQNFNTYLANQYGNLISRTIQMTDNSFESIVPEYKEETKESKELNKYIDSKIKEYKEQMDKYEINNSIDICISILGELNKYIDVTMPWTLKEDKDKLATILNDLFKGINNITILLNPFLTKGTLEAMETLSLKKDFSFSNLDKDLKGTKVIKKNIYSRLK